WVADMDGDTGRVGELPIEPNLILETSPGNGQPFWLFDRPLKPEEAKPLAAALKRATGSDHGTADVAHVWRVPGTSNHPNKKKLERGRSPDPVDVTVAQEWDGTLTGVEELRAALAPWMTAAAEGRSVEVGDLPSIDGIAVSPAAAELLSENDVEKRSEHAAAVVEKLAFDGHPVEEACALFLSAEGNWLARYETEARARADFERMWGKFGQRHVDARETNANAVAGLVAKKGTPVPANDNDPKAAPPRVLPVPPGMCSDPFSLSSAGGLLAEISEWITSTAIIPVPELSLTSAIALLGGMFGDRALGPTRSGLNLYLATVMGVASGKGHAPKSIITLASNAGKPGAVTNGDPTSYAAIERILRKNISTVCVMDELGVTLQDVNSRHKNSAAASIRKFLLTVYDQADSVFHGRQYASDETKKDDSPLVGPALTILGMTTPTTLYAGLSDDSLNDGFLSRFVFIEGAGPEEVTAPKLNRSVSLPKPLIASLKVAYEAFPKPDRSATQLRAPKFQIPFEGDESGDAYKLWAEVFHWQHWKGWEPREYHVNGRAAENTVRLASIRAISRDPAKPLVMVEDVEWAWAIVHRSIAIITEGVERHMAGSIAESLRKAIVRALSQAKDKTLPWSQLLQREGVSHAEGDDVAKSIQWLIETGKVVDLSGRSKPGARASFKLLDEAKVA
ncbi:DNA-primase RepB domain-containing protein, partial [Allomesorhizobium alhagi]